jgi:hypothetical protein
MIKARSSYSMSGERKIIDGERSGQIHTVRGFPFLLADIKIVVARRAAPVDPRRRPPDEAAVLPEVRRSETRRRPAIRG